jgi:hypothetical protein
VTSEVDGEAVEEGEPEDAKFDVESSPESLVLHEAPVAHADVVIEDGICCEREDRSEYTSKEVEAVDMSEERELMREETSIVLVVVEGVADVVEENEYGFEFEAVEVGVGVADVTGAMLFPPWPCGSSREFPSDVYPRPRARRGRASIHSASKS